jgi:hypothetical protein
MQPNALFKANDFPRQHTVHVQTPGWCVSTAQTANCWVRDPSMNAAFLLPNDSSLKQAFHYRKIK